MLRLQVSNAANRDETVIYFNPDAQNSVDDYDTQKMFNNITDVPEIYTQYGTTKLVINGMNVIPFETEIPLGFTSGEVGNFSIKSTEFKNFEEGTRVILRDKEKMLEYELNDNNAYTFTSDAVNTANRFSLLFRAPGATTGVIATEKLNAQVFVNATNQITIIAPEKSNYAVYNALGQLIENGVTNTERETRNTKQKAAGVYVVKVNNQSTRVIIK